MKDLVYPDPVRPAQLAAELSRVCAGLPGVIRVVGFGSLARGRGDRWSDVDLLVVTARETDGRALVAALAAHKPVRYHAPVRPSADHPGGHALGIVFAAESVFHTLDLNFMARSAYRQGGAGWFGPTVDYYVAPAEERSLDPEGPSEDSPGAAVWASAPDPGEMAIDAAIYWIRRALRRVLRTGHGRDDLAARHAELQRVLRGRPEGAVSRLAGTYLALTEYLLPLAL